MTEVAFEKRLSQKLDLIKPRRTICKRWSLLMLGLENEPLLDFSLMNLQGDEFSSPVFQCTRESTW